jgi:hypothetical protein
MPGRWRLPLAAALVVIIGCGGGLGLTGGSVPIGTSRLAGIAVRGDSLTTPVPNVKVTLQTGSSVATKGTDSSGHFEFSRIAGGGYECTMDSPAGTGLKTGWSWAFDLPEGSAAQLVAALLPASTDSNSVKETDILPAGATMHVGDTVRFVSSSYGEGHSSIAIAPSLLLSGNIGDLSADGTIHATTVGQAKLLSWVNGNDVKVVQINVVP